MSEATYNVIIKTQDREQFKVKTSQITSEEAVEEVIKKTTILFGTLFLQTPAPQGEGTLIRADRIVLIEAERHSDLAI